MQSISRPRALLAVASGLLAMVSAPACNSVFGTPSGYLSPEDSGPDGRADGGADGPSDGRADRATDAATDGRADGGCTSAPSTDFYVNATTGEDDAGAPWGGDPSCPFKTITAALSASENHFNSAIHLAAGKYGAGEMFPLIVDRGRSLLGAGAQATIIEGSSGAFEMQSTGSVLDGTPANITVVAGDALGGPQQLTATQLSGLTLLPDATIKAPTGSYMGLVCTIGNGPAGYSSGPATFPPPNLIVRGVTFGPNFDVGALLGSQPQEGTACNASFLASTFTGCNSGLSASTCGSGGDPRMSWPGARVGDGTDENANVFSGSRYDIFGNGCGAFLSVDDNRFTSGYVGIVLESPNDQYLEILHNTFDGTSGPLRMGIGLETGPDTVISALNDNTFTNIAESAAANASANGTTGFAFNASILFQAQRNVIHDNDNGIWLTGSPGSIDFSSDGNPANANTIYCNSKLPDAGANGYDVRLDYTSGAPLQLEGNIWDHAPPSSGTTVAAPNGTDLMIGPSAGVVATGGASIGTMKCESGRVQ